jgi:hypothetical protein
MGEFIQPNQVMKSIRLPGPLTAILHSAPHRMVDWASDNVAMVDRAGLSFVQSFRHPSLQRFNNAAEFPLLSLTAEVLYLRAMAVLSGSKPPLSPHQNELLLRQWAGTGLIGLLSFLEQSADINNPIPWPPILTHPPHSENPFIQHTKVDSPKSFPARLGLEYFFKYDNYKILWYENHVGKMMRDPNRSPVIVGDLLLKTEVTEGGIGQFILSPVAGRLQRLPEMPERPHHQYLTGEFFPRQERTILLLKGDSQAVWSARETLLDGLNASFIRPETIPEEKPASSASETVDIPVNSPGSIRSSLSTFWSLISRRLHQ